jgi:hypothetical protein
MHSSWMGTAAFVASAFVTARLVGFFFYNFYNRQVLLHAGTNACHQ